MTTKYFAILTNQGAARLANATALGTKLNITQMAVGDGGGTLPTPDPAQTKLVNQTRIAPINSLGVAANDAGQIIAEQIIPENEGGFFIREIGLYDDDGVLIAVANCPETYKPLLAEGSGRTQTIRMILVVSSTSAITLKIDPSVVLATRKYVDDAVIEVKSYADKLMKDHEAKANPHKQYPLIENALKEMADAGLVDKVLENLGLQDSFSGRVLRVKKITASQLYEWPDDVAEIDVTICGAGGGAGAGASTPAGYCSAGPGGGAGGSARSRYKRGDIPLSVPIEIGAGGIGGISGGAQPTNGGDTKFGDLMSATGGSRGINNSAIPAGTNAFMSNGGGGDGAGGNLFSSQGGSGTPAVFFSNGFESGAGGDSIFSFGAPPLAAAIAMKGIDGIDGAGGSGAYVPANSSGTNGGKGGNGVCLIVEYSK